MSPNKVIKIIYYITGHGYGHSTRAYATIAQMLKRGHHVTIVTSAPVSIFSDLLSAHPSRTAYRYLLIDPGVSQRDAVTVDRAKTMSDFKNFMQPVSVAELERLEEAAVRAFLPDFICLDASFLPARIANRLGIPSAIISNFTFDEIYSAMVTSDLEMQLVTECIEMYKGASTLIRLPGFINIPSFSHRPSHIKDVALVVRKSRLQQDHVRSRLGISKDAKFVLISFGGHELFKTSQEGGWTEELVLPPGWIGVVIGPGKQFESKQGSRLLSARSEDWYMPDLINACNVVLSKCGYGMCSETVAHRKPLIYVPRPSFVEEQGLLNNLMIPYGHAIEMPQSDFYSGKWKEYIETADQCDFTNVKRIPGNGDEEAVDLVESLAESGIILT